MAFKHLGQTEPGTFQQFGVPRSGRFDLSEIGRRFFEQPIGLFAVGEQGLGTAHQLEIGLREQRPLARLGSRFLLGDPLQIVNLLVEYRVPAAGARRLRASGDRFQVKTPGHASGRLLPSGDDLIADHQHEQRNQATHNDPAVRHDHFDPCADPIRQLVRFQFVPSFRLHSVFPWPPRGALLSVRTYFKPPR